MRLVSRLALLTVAAALVGPAASASAQTITEPRSGVSFPEKANGMTALGTGLRTKTFLRVKVYAIALYVADAALAPGGALSAHKGKTTTSEFYRDLIFNDFPKQVTLRMVRDVSTEQIRNAFREALPNADKARAESFISYFGESKEGQEYVIRWVPGGTLDITVGGQAKPPITDKGFAAAVFGIWLGTPPVQEDIKKELVSRAATLIQ